MKGKEKTVCIVQARMGSTRLPGKVLKPILGKPMLGRIVERLRFAHSIHAIVVATSTHSQDDAIAEFCRIEDVSLFRGSEEDVLDRFYGAARQENADICLRVTGDCPLIDPGLIDTLVARYIQGQYDFYAVATGAGTADGKTRGRFPDGLDAEVFSFRALETAWNEAMLPIERAHVTPFIWKHPQRFRLGLLEGENDYGDLRWTVDHPEDYELVQWIYAELYPRDRKFGMQMVLDALKKAPPAILSNSQYLGKENYEIFWRTKKAHSSRTEDSMNKGQHLYLRAKKLIPGGTQLFSKRPEQFAPEVWPPYYSKAKGTQVWDCDGREYTDMSIMGIGANVLGYADDEVDAAVMDAVRNGVSATLNCPEEVELAEVLTSMHPWAHMVRYARSGGEAMAIAVRIARASRKRDTILFNGYHGWADWYLAANLSENSALDGQLMPGLEANGVPRGLTGTSLPFFLDDLDELEKRIRGKEKEIAAIVIEPARGEEVSIDALRKLRDIADTVGAALVFDEITSAFRMNPGGIHLRYGVNPDIAVFAKSMANGYAMAAVIGTEEVMQAAQATFISSTNWTERIGPVAALATIRKYVREKVHEHIIPIGNSTKEVWKKAASKYGLPVKISGIPTLASFSFDSPHNATWSTYFVVGMLRQSFLAFRQFKPSFAHTKDHVRRYAESVEHVFEEIARTDPGSLLETPPARSGFYRLAKE